MLARREIAPTTKWRRLSDLAGIAAGGARRRSAPPSPMFSTSPISQLAAAAALAPDVGAVLVHGFEPRRLIGPFPCRIELARYGIRLPLLAGWTHAYGPLGTLLVDRDALHPVSRRFSTTSPMMRTCRSSW